MAKGYTIQRNRYFDSVFLMQVAKRLSEEPGINQVAVLMGTEKNKVLLAEIGFEDAGILAAGANDLIMALIGEKSSIIDPILGDIDSWLFKKPTVVGEPTVRTLADAIACQPHANLACVSVPGEYATHETRNALKNGLNVFLFSSNVPLEDELALKQYAKERELIVMGPDCGTAIIAGVGLGFANVVRRGPIGVIGAAGTGLQEFTSLVHQSGSGISHAIGTGGRDLSDAVGGLSALSALRALEEDPTTEVIAILSKPPGANTLLHLIGELNKCTKPVATCFLGIRQYPSDMDINFSTARTLDDAVTLALQNATGNHSLYSGIDTHELQLLVTNERTGMTREQQFIRGIFAGGTFCYQAQQVMRDGGIVVHSNAPLDGMLELANPLISESHTIVDMGSEMFTEGRPHPMIDATLRRERILEEANDPQVAILLLDFVLGFNSSMDPVGDLVEAILEAKQIVHRRGGNLSVVASVCGTDEDPQDFQKQVHALENAGVVVLPSSAQAAMFCRTLASAIQGKE